MENSTRDFDHKATADMVLQRALARLEERGVPLDVTLDRITTMAAGAHVSLVGSTLAASCFRDYAKQIQQGTFARVGARH